MIQWYDLRKNSYTENDFHANKNRLWNKNEQKKNDFHRKTETIVKCAYLCKMFQQPNLMKLMFKKIQSSTQFQNLM